MKLELCQIRAGYHGQPPALDSVSIGVPQGSVSALLGPNGSGKSTLLKTAAGLLRPTSGEVRLDGVPLSRISPAQRASKLAFLPQSPPLPDETSVAEFVRMGRFPHSRSRFGFLTAHDHDIIARALESMDLIALKDRDLHALSGGERQRARLAMALAQEPSVLLLDEPTTFLDLRGQLDVLSMIRSLNRDLGITVLTALHDLNLAARFADRVFLLHDHAVLAEGTPDEVLTQKNLRTAFAIEADLCAGADGILRIYPLPEHF